MAKGPVITDKTRRTIAEVYLEHPDWPAKQIQDEVNRKLNSDSPGLSAVQKELAKLREKQAQAPDPLDAPWSLGCLAQYDIPPEALPIVMLIYENRLREREQYFPIREALWIGRLYKIIDDPIFLERFASAYALREKIYWILDNPTYTRPLDITLIRYGRKGSRAEFDNYGLIDPLLATSEEEQEELRKKVKQKGYEIEMPGEKLLWKRVDSLVEEIKENMRDKRIPEDIRKRMVAFVQNYSERKRKAKEAHHERTPGQKG